MQFKNIEIKKTKQNKIEICMQFWKKKMVLFFFSQLERFFIYSINTLFGSQTSSFKKILNKYITNP